MKHIFAFLIIPLFLFVSCVAFAMDNDNNSKEKTDEFLSASAEPNLPGDQSIPLTGFLEKTEFDDKVESMIEQGTKNSDLEDANPLQNASSGQLGYPHGWSREYQKRANGGWLCEGKQYSYKLQYAVNEGFGDSARLLEIEVLSHTTEVDWGEAFILSRGLESSGKKAKAFNDSAVIVSVKMWDSSDPSLPIAGNSDDLISKNAEMARITIED